MVGSNGLKENPDSAVRPKQDTLRDAQPLQPDGRSNSDPVASSDSSRDAWGKPHQPFDWKRMRADSDEPTFMQDSARIPVEDLEQSPKRLSAELLRQLQNASDKFGPGMGAQRQSSGSDRGGGHSSRGASSGNSGRSGRGIERIVPAATESDQLQQNSAQTSDSNHYRHQLAAAFVADTLRALPCRAEAVSHLRGPVLQLNPVDHTSVDVRVFHSFRAHFPRAELQQALSNGQDGFMGLSQPEELNSLLEEMTMTASDNTERSNSNFSGQDSSLDQRAFSRAPSGEVEQPSSRGGAHGPGSPHGAQPRYHSAPGDPASWLHRSGIPKGAVNTARRTSNSSSRRHRYTASPLTSPNNSTGLPLHLTGKRPSPQEMTELTPFAGSDLTMPSGVPLSMHHSGSLGRARQPSSDADTDAGLDTPRSGDPFSLENLPSDSTGGLTASQEGMRSPIVMDEVVDAVQAARSKLANLTSEKPIGPVPNSLASYDQSHIRRGALTEAQKAQLGGWEIDANNVIIGERIAMGGFAEVFIGKFEGTVVAIKLLLMFDDITTDRVLKEVAALAQLRHPNLILFMGFCLQPRPAIICEFMQRGSLFKVLRKQDGPLDGKLARAIAIAVTRGMAYLHGRSPVMLHLDLKSPNILLDDRWHCKIADFGLSQTRERTLLSRGAAGGTPEWMAPEMLRCEPFDERADVYSFGVCLWEILTGDVPWTGLHAMQVVGAVGFQRKTLPRPEHSERFLVELCMKCMNQEPSQRPYFPAIVRDLEQEFAPAKLTSLSTSLSEAAKRELGNSGTSIRDSDEPVAHRLFQQGGNPATPGRRRS